MDFIIIMSRITPIIESWVIDEYSRGETLDQIADKTNLSKGTVYNIVKKWKSQLGGGNIDEVRKFRNALKKSGFTIEDCTLGFRMIKMLDKFNLHDDFEKPFTDLSFYRSLHKESINKSDLEEFASHFATEELRDKDNIRINGNEILSFLVDIYEPCRRSNIKSTDIIKWIQDLLINFSHNDKSDIKIDKIIGKDKLSKKDELIEIPLITQVNTFLEGKNQQYLI